MQTSWIFAQRVTYSIRILTKNMCDLYYEPLLGFMIKKPERLKLLQDAEREWPNYMKLLLLILYIPIYKKEKKV